MGRTRQIRSTLHSSLVLPENTSGRILDFDPGYLPSVWGDTGGTVAGTVGQGVAALDCRVSGWRLTQATAGNRFVLEAQGSGYRLAQTDTTTRFLTAASLPEWLPVKLRAPLTVAWWIRPDVVPPAGSPQYHWEIYNSAESTPHLSAQYNDPNDASSHKRFTFVRRRSDTTGTSNIQVRVDDAIYPNASIGTWLMLAMVHDGDPLDSRYRMFMNGLQIGVLTGVASFYQGLTVNAGMWLGCRNVTGNFARSRIRRWTAWERALSSAELHRMWVTTRDAWALS